MPKHNHGGARPGAGRPSAYDRPPPRYTGPDLIGKQLKAPPFGVGPQWIGKPVTIERRVPRGHIDILPARDNVGA